MVKILSENNGELEFSNEIQEYILDSKMELKAVKLKSGQVIDHEHLHRHFSPKHPLLSTPTSLKRTLDQFFVQEFMERRTAPIC